MSVLLRPGEPGHVETMRFMRLAADVAKSARCLRAQAGSVIASSGLMIGTGHNSPPGGCQPQACVKDALAPTFKSDRTCCVHAEQNAILNACIRNPRLLAGSQIYFVRVDEAGEMRPAGIPYCTICSKLTQAAGIAEFALLREGGAIEVYDADEYNRISFAHPSGRAAADTDHDPGEVS